MKTEVLRRCTACFCIKIAQIEPTLICSSAVTSLLRKLTIISIHLPLFIGGNQLAIWITFVERSVQLTLQPQSFSSTLFRMSVQKAFTSLHNVMSTLRLLYSTVHRYNCSADSCNSRSASSIWWLAVSYSDLSPPRLLWPLPLLLSNSRVSMRPDGLRLRLVSTRREVIAGPIPSVASRTWSGTRQERWDDIAGSSIRKLPA